MPEEFKVETVVDASGSQAGADKTVESLKQIQAATEEQSSSLGGLEEATKKVTESTHSLGGEQLGSIRTIHHLVEGLLELREGGGSAIAGLALETRIAGEVFESALGPAAPFVIILSTLLAIGIPALQRALHKTGEEAKEGFGRAGEASDTFKQKMEQAAEAVRKGAEIATAALTLQLDEMKQFDAQYQKESGYQAQAAKDTEARTEAENKLTLAKLEGQKQSELAKAASEDERVAIEAKYRRLEAGASSATAQQKYDTQFDEFGNEAAARADQLRATQEQRGVVERKLQDLQQHAAETAAAAQSFGLKPDANGSFAAATTQAQEDSQRKQKELQKAEDEHAAPAKQDRLARELAETFSAVHAGQQAESARLALDDQGKALNTTFRELTDSAEKLRHEYDSLLFQRGTLEVTHQADLQTEKNKSTDESSKDTRKLDEERYARREAQRQAQVERWQAELRQEGIDPKLKDMLEGNIARTRIAGYRDDLQSNDSTLTDAQKIALQGKIGAAGETRKVDAGNAAAKSETEQEKQTRHDIESVEGQIKNTGSKAMIEAMHRVVDLFQGKAGESQQLDELAALTSVLAGNFSQYAAKTDGSLKSLSRSIDSLKNNHHN